VNYGIYLSSVGYFSDPSLLGELAAEAEASGWDGAFIWDHIGQPCAAADPWVALTAMAMKTKRIKLGPVVTPMARRRPWKLARETVSLDRLSNGRLILGVGLGWSPSEFEAFGEDGDPRIRAAKLDEGLDVLAGLWGGEKFYYIGVHYQIKGARFLPRPVQKPRIPIWVCGGWGRMKSPFRRAARWDGVVAIEGTGENRGIRLDEVKAIQEYVQQHRQEDDPFDIVIIRWSDGGHKSSEIDEIGALADAGLTWWLEDLSTERFNSLEDIRRRLRLGPPGNL